jgi:ribonucleoside-diphosphate reductase alpha chain
MRHAKSGEWWNINPEFNLANNSSCHTEKPNAETFIREWKALIESKSGERGIFNRVAARLIAGRNGRRDTNYEFGTNPCSEIILRSRQVCNLSEVVVRQRDTFEDLKRKVRLATFIGTLQATLTNFRYLSPEWRKNTEEEALLGVSMTGIMDHPILSGRMDLDIEDNFYRLQLWLKDLREEAIETNKYFAERLGIRPAAAITAVKPSGTVSQLVDSASGIHPRYSQYYIRTVRNDIKDPVSKAMVDMGIPYEVDVTNPSNYVFSFPIKAPEGCVTRNEMSAIEQLELWKIYQNHWCEHKPSITVYVEDKEWMKVGAWVYENFDIVSGVSFLPKSDHTYRQAPYQEITSDEYYKLLVKMPEFVDWSVLAKYESEDNTTGLQEYACSSGNCEL